MGGVLRTEARCCNQTGSYLIKVHVVLDLGLQTEASQNPRYENGLRPGVEKPLVGEFHLRNF